MPASPRSNLKPSTYTAGQAESQKNDNMDSDLEKPRQIPDIWHRPSPPARRIRRRYDDDDDDDDDEEDDDFVYDATWKEVFQACCVHSLYEWAKIFFACLLIFACLYLFGLGLDFLSSGAKVMTSCATGELFGSETNPVASLMIGILATVFLQSSSSTTSIVVSLVAADNSIVSVQQGIYMIMGANIGTTVTSTIVSLGHFTDRAQLELAFAGATIHDLFNFFSVAVLFPLEVATGYLYTLTAAFARGTDTEDGDRWEGPVKRFISPLGRLVLIANKRVTTSVASGGSCDDFYPLSCEDPDDPTKSTCKVGLIDCDKTSNRCPLFFQVDASREEDQLSGFVVFIIGLVVIFIALFVMVRALQSLLLDVSIRILYKATDLNSYLLIAGGAGITIFLQSSSALTSIVIPVVGIGALRLEQLYPIVIGANIGTTLTTLLSALVTDGNDSLQVALAHLMFNISGMMIWFPIPFMRRIPVLCAARLGQGAGIWRAFPVLYIFMLFFLLPAMFLGLSALFEEGIKQSSTLFIGIGSTVTVFLAGVLLWGISWWYCFGGSDKLYDHIDESIRIDTAVQSLMQDMDRARAIVACLRAHMGLQEDEAEINTDNRSETSITGPISEIQSILARRRKIQQAIKELPDDIKSVDNKLTLLIQATGISTENLHNTMETSEEHSDGVVDAQHHRPPSLTGPPPDIPCYDRSENVWKLVPMLHRIVLMGVLFTLLILLPILFTQHAKAWQGLASFICALGYICGMYFLFWWHCYDGRQIMMQRFSEYHQRNEAIASLPENMRSLQKAIDRLNENCGAVGGKR